MSLVRFLEVPLKAPNPLLYGVGFLFHRMWKGNFPKRRGNIELLSQTGRFSIFRRGSKGTTSEAKLVLEVPLKAPNPLLYGVGFLFHRMWKGNFPKRRGNIELLSQTGRFSIFRRGSKGTTSEAKLVLEIQLTATIQFSKLTTMAK